MIKKNLFILFALIFLVVQSFPQQSPDEYFGFKIGADRTLVKYPEIVTYFKYLDGASGRVKVTDEGKSTLGNPIYLAFISSKENIKHLPELIEINKKLANPDTLSKEEADALLKKAKVFVLVTCTLHATEIAASQMAMLWAHKLAVTDDPDLNEYLDNVVIMLMPSINPDGNIMVTEWYEKYLGTEFEGCRMPYLYHHYAGHDDNRDYYMLNLKESKVVNAILHHRYFPIIFLDMHQMGSSGPRMFVPPFKDPLNQNLNPLLVRETNIIGSFMALKLQEKGKRGVASSYAFDAYWPGGSKNTAWFKNVVGLLTELASVKTASPIYIEPNELRVRSKGLPEYKAQVNFPDPWPGGWWRMQDIIDYEMIAVDSLLEISSKNKESFLKNFYKLGIDTVKKGKEKAPYGYVIPVEQWDTPAAYTFLRKMEEHGIRIYKLEETVRTGNRIYRKGSFVLPLAQPYGNFLKVMMERQRYPEIKHMAEGPIIEPYDASGWTMPLQMGVKSFQLTTSPETFKLTPVKDLAYPEETITGEGNYYCIPARFNRSVMVVNRLFKKGVGVSRYTRTQKSAEGAAQGDFLVKASSLNSEKMKALLTGTGVSIRKINLRETGAVTGITPPRIGIYQSYRASMDEGWTRWVLDHFEFPYTVLYNKDFENGTFSRRYDVVIFVDMGRDTILKGAATGYRAYYYMSMPPQYKGGIGDRGLINLKNFVQRGGSIVLLDSAAELGIKDFSLPLVDIMKGVKSEDFFCPGSILRLRIDTTDPVAWGLEEDHFIFFRRSSAFRTRMPVLKSIDRKVVAGFNGTGNHLLSGYLKGGKKLDRAVMIVRFDYYDGKVIVLGGRVQHRAQTYGTFKFLFNSLYYSTLKNR
jgi:hypothetical protein